MNCNIDNYWYAPYDRHYPEYMRALGLNGAEIVILPQAGAEREWPEGLHEAEMRVAAFQNGYFIALWTYEMAVIVK